jgi:hypothetical protein
MVNVTDCSDIDMRLCPRKFFLRHLMHLNGYK